MSNLATLSCPNCGGKLEITPDVERFACAYCGHEHVVNRGGGIITLKPVVEKIDQVRASVDRGVDASEHVAAELALQRIDKEMHALTLELKGSDPGMTLAVIIMFIGIIPIGLGFLILVLVQSYNELLGFISVATGAIITLPFLIAAIWALNRSVKERTARESKLHALEREKQRNQSILTKSAIR